MKWQYTAEKKLSHWLICFVLMDFFFSFLVWLVRPEIFGRIFVMIILFTAFAVMSGYWWDRRKKKRQMEALQMFLNNQDEEIEQQLLEAVDEYWHPVLLSASKQLKEQRQVILDNEFLLQNYQEFIEAWTHEIKTPLYLASLVLENHRDEMSSHVYRRMEHVRYSIGSGIDLILYYARLQAEHVDYKFERLDLSEVVRECLREFHAIAEEKGIVIRLALLPLQVVSDKKVLLFMLSQLLSNALKYTAKEQGEIRIAVWSDTQQGSINLAVRDNGKGAPLEDRPFLFDKGFTGNHSNRQNATGMGLYLVKKYAQALSAEVELEPESVIEKGVGVRLIFPEVAAASDN